MDEEPQPYDPAAVDVAAARAQLEVARRSGRSGSIALAHFALAATLAAHGDQRSAADEYQELIAYLDLAAGDAEGDTQRWIRRVSPAAPPPEPEDTDPAQLQVLARIELAQSLLDLGLRDEARHELDLAASGARGFGRGGARRRIAAVRRRMADTTVGATRPGAVPSDVGLREQVAAADELLGAGRFEDSARLALRAIANCPEGDPQIRARARQVLGMALDGMGRAADAAVVLRDALADYLAAEELAAAVTIATSLAWRSAQAADWPAAIDRLTAVLDAVGDRGGPALRARLLIDLGSLQDQAGRADTARATLTAAGATARTVADPQLVADADHGLAIVLATRSTDPDDSVEALALLDDCRRVYDDAGLPDRAAGCEHEAAALLGRLSSYEPAAARYRRALERYTGLPEVLRDTGSWPDEMADCELNLAALAAAAGDPAALAGDRRLFHSGGHAMTHGSS